MLKSLASKIFFGFTLLVFLEAILLSFVFGRNEIRTTETYILDALSSRLEEKKREFENGSEVFFISETGKPALDLIPSDFQRAALEPLLPPSGSAVTVCQDQKMKNYYCGFSFVSSPKGWVFDFVSQSTLTEAITSKLISISPFLLGLLLVSLLLTYILSSSLLGPLRRFSLVSASIAKGSYEKVQLPTHREDEIGDLSRAFERMTTDLKDRESQLKISGLKLAHSARLASLGQMGASIAHEVKNPLTAMMGYAKVLKNKTVELELKEAAEIIFKESERCNQILMQMLRFARNDPDESKPYLLKDVVQSVVLLMKAEARAQKVELKAGELSDTVIIGSAQQIQQVLINLIANAIHASKPQGIVSIQVTENQDYAKVLVQDAGEGIPKEIQAKIFDPFFTTKSQEGTGLGLSVSREIVTQQGGLLGFQSEEGKGTTFELSLRLPAIT